MSSPSLAGKIALVTGATRGVGKGIAVQLAEAGALVYITGRTLKASEKGSGGSLEETAKEIVGRGGQCIPIQCDHSKDKDVEQLFETISADQNGQLDILVNNTFAGFSAIADAVLEKKKFWECDPNIWDDINNVGLRNHYFCSVYGARMMVERKQGLIVNVSSAGGLRYLFMVPYGIGKAAVDRMAADCAVELRKNKVAVVSLWPGGVRTENMLDMMQPEKVEQLKGFYLKLSKMMGGSETPEYVGKAVVHLAADANVMKKSGRVLITGDLGDEYGFTDVGGVIPTNLRSLRSSIAFEGYATFSQFIPRWLKIPKWVLALVGSKF